MGMRDLSRLLEEVTRGRWWISRDFCDGCVMASFLLMATFSCTDLEQTDELSFEKYATCFCLDICAAELKALVGARQSSAIGQAQGLSGKLGAYNENK